MRKATRTYSIARTTLNNNFAKAKKESTTKFEPNYKHSHIFNQEQETSLANYLEKCSGMFHGLPTKHVCTLAFINQMLRSWDKMAYAIIKKDSVAMYCVVNKLKIQSTSIPIIRDNTDSYNSKHSQIVLRHLILNFASSRAQFKQ